jgi:predicted RNase H-like HicB family nuclease
MRFLIMLEQTETGFAVQAPDLAIATYGENVEAAKRAAGEAIRVNLEAYREAGQQVPEVQSVQTILRIPSFGICCSRTST